jgi:hypothetical protein
MNLPAIDHGIAVDDYLAGEKDGEVRHEYVAGQVYAMTGASRTHGLIAGALFAHLRPLARDHGCQLFANDMKVHVHQAGEDAFYYPDLVLTCDAEDRADYYSEPPCLIVEVLCESTERIDRREKLFAYTARPAQPARIPPRGPGPPAGGHLPARKPTTGRMKPSRKARSISTAWTWNCPSRRSTRTWS